MGNLRSSHSCRFCWFICTKVNRRVDNNKDTKDTIEIVDKKLEDNEILGTVKEITNIGLLVTVSDLPEKRENMFALDSEVIFTYSEKEMIDISDTIKKGYKVKFKIPDQAIATMSLPPQMPNVEIIEIIK